LVLITLLFDSIDIAIFNISLDGWGYSLVLI